MRDTQSYYCIGVSIIGACGLLFWLVDEEAALPLLQLLTASHVSLGTVT